MASPFADFKINPSYSSGFLYLWEMTGDFNARDPWVFAVQEGPSANGPWTTISPDIENAYSWKEESHKTVNKSNVLYFRIRLVADGTTYFSPVIQPYGTLPRRDFLLAREIMRQAMLHSKGLAGKECAVYLRSTFGPKCTHCLDPITGMVRDSHCTHCLGTGRDPAYIGPYTVWADFSEDTQHQTDTDKNGTIEKKSFQVRVVGNPTLKHGDVLADTSSGKRYVIDTVALTTEIRRIPILQTLVVEEAPQTDKIYDL